jgi:hypothetical protein
MKKLLLSLVLASTLISTANAAIWVRGVYIVGIQPNCNNTELLRLFWSDKPSDKFNWNKAICSRYAVDHALTKSYMALGQSAMALGQKVDLELSDHGYLNDIIVRAD